MSVYYTSTDTLEMARDRVRQLLSKVEDTAGTLRQMYNQMITEISFSQFPQWITAIENCGNAVEDCETLARRIESLLSVIETATDKYQENERENRFLIEQLSARIMSLQAGIDTVMSAGYPVGILEGEASSAATALERQTSDAVQDLEIANLMAVTKVLENEYNYEKVEAVQQMGYVEPNIKTEDMGDSTINFKPEKQTSYVDPIKKNEDEEV